VFHRRVRAGKHERFVPVLVTHEVRRFAVLPSDLDDLGQVLGLADRATVHVQAVSYLCAHDEVPPCRVAVEETSVHPSR
jgi:hypothetical protein